MVTKRRSKTKRKTTKRKTTKRTTKRKPTKRKTTKRKTTKRKVTKRKATKRKAVRRKTSSSKKGLESKIAELEAQLSKLSTEAKAPPPPPPPPKAETPPPPPPKPAEKPKAAPPANLQDALENAWQNVPMGNWNEMKAKVTGYVPESNRAWARRHAPRGTAASSGDWNVQKAKVTGYAPASNQYFATRQRLSYNPPDKNFGSFSLTVEGATAQTQSAPPPPPPAETSSTSAGSSSYPKTKQELLEEYEKDYLARLEQQEADAEVATAEEAKASESTTHGTLPKGF